MLESSKDVLNLVLGFSILLVAALFSWVLYQMGRMIKNVNDTMKTVQKIVTNIDESINNFKSKAGNAAAFLTVFMKGAQEVVKTINKKRSKKTSK